MWAVVASSGVRYNWRGRRKEKTELFNAKISLSAHIIQ